MKYIDTKTERSLKRGVMELLKLTNNELDNMFESIYYDAEKEPGEWVEDFLSDYIVDENLEYIQMFHLTRRLDGSDIKANDNLEQLLLEESPLSCFFKKYNVTFKKADDHIELLYKGRVQPLDNEFRYSDRGNIYYVRNRLGYNTSKDYCVNGFAFRWHLEEEQNGYFRSLSNGPELMQNIGWLLGINNMIFDYCDNSKYYCIEYLVPLSEVIFDMNYPPESDRDKLITFLKYSILRLYEGWRGSSFVCDENLIIRLSDDAIMQAEWFINAEEV